MKTLSNLLNESSLSRLRQHMITYDTAMISASRGQLSNCLHDEDDGKQLSRDNNMTRHRKLRAAIYALGYGFTDVLGTYYEELDDETKQHVKENSLLVFNRNNDPKFFERMKKLGEEFCQDSIILKEKGKDSEAMLYGTNKASDPGYGNSFSIGMPFFGQEDQGFGDSRVGNRPFVFTEHHISQLNSISRMGLAIAQPILEKHNMKRFFKSDKKL